MTRVLITGGLGFIGSNLARTCLKDGEYVTILSKSKDKINNISGIEDKVKLVIKDVKDIGKEVRKKDVIYHLVGSTDNYSILEEKPYYDIDLNCTSTISLLEACKKYNPSVKILFASTFFVNGQQEKLPVTVESPCNPLGLYGATRLAGEHFCRIYGRIFDLNTTIARFTNVFGIPERGDNKKKAAFNYLINLGTNNEDIPVYEGGNFLRDYIYVDDVATACRVIAKKGERGATYYVGRGEFIKFIDLVKMITEEVGGRIKKIATPDFHKRVGITNFVADVSPLRSLGWEPLVSIREGIRRTAEYYKDGSK